MTELTVKEKADVTYILAFEKGYRGNLADWRIAFARLFPSPADAVNGKIRNANYCGMPSFEKAVENGFTGTKDDYVLGQYTVEAIVMDALLSKDKLKPNDLVVFHCGGPSMAVVKQEDDQVTAMYMQSGIHTRQYDRKQLVKVFVPGEYRATDLENMQRMAKNKG